MTNGGRRRERISIPGLGTFGFLLFFAFQCFPQQFGIILDLDPEGRKGSCMTRGKKRACHHEHSDESCVYTRRARERERERERESETERQKDERQKDREREAVD